VSSENGAAAITCSRTAVGDWEKFDWVVNADGKISLRGNNGRYVSSENGTTAMTCNRTAISGWEAFSWGTGTPTGRSATNSLGSEEEPGVTAIDYYPNPVTTNLTYKLPEKTKQHAIRVVDMQGIEVMTASFGDTGDHNTVDASTWREGLYVIRVYNKQFNKTLKIIKK
jgi:hypothetical protein